MTLCFRKTIVRNNGQIDEEHNNNTCRQGLRWSLGIVAVQWIAVILLVVVNIAVDGAYHFYGPTGLCELICLSCTAYLDKGQGAGFRATTRSSVLQQISFSCG